MERTGWKRIALFALVPALAISAFALPRAMAWGRHHHAESPAELREHLEEGLDHLLDRVDASDAQRKQANAIAARRAPELFALMGEGRKLRTQLKEALLAPQIDRAKVDQARADLDVLTDKIGEVGLSSVLEVAELLTPAQRKEVADKLAKFHR